MYTAQHHLATQNLPTLQSTGSAREFIEQAMAEFEARGGVIKQCAIRIGGDVGGQWNAAGQLFLSNGNSCADADIAELIKPLAAKGAGIVSISYQLSIDARRIKRIAKVFGIEIQSQRGGFRTKSGPNEANRKATAERGRKHREEVYAQAKPMLDAGKTRNEIASALHCSKLTLAKAITENSHVAD